MGLLDNILGGQGRGSHSNNPSAMTLALMALLAYRTYQGKGRLAEMLGRKAPGSVPQPGNSGAAPGGAAQAPGAGGGGLGDILGGILGRSPAGTGAAGAEGGGLGGMLGGLLGGSAAGGFMGTGLNELLQRFQQTGHAQTAQSWVNTGANAPITPEQVESAVGRDTVQTLADQTGTPYEQVLSDLSKGLPQTIDQLTPEGRVPAEHETSHWV